MTLSTLAMWNLDGKRDVRMLKVMFNKVWCWKHLAGTNMPTGVETRAANMG